MTAAANPGKAVMRTRLLLLPLLLSFLPVIAQESLTLQRAWQIALVQNLSLQQQAQQISRAQEELAIQKSGYLPTLSAGASYRFVSELARLELPFSLPNTPTEIEAGVKNQYALTLNLQQPLFTGFRTANLIRSARRQHQAQIEQREVLRNQLLLQVGLLYYDIQLNMLQQGVLQQAVERADLQLNKVRNLLQAGQATAFDTLEVANRRLQAASDRGRLEDDRSILLSQLSYLINTPGPVTVDSPATGSADLSLEPLQNYRQAALEKRPELRQMAALRQAQSFRTGALKSAYWPQIFASASYNYARPGVNFFRDQWMDYYTVGINLSWNLWDWKRDRRAVEQSRIEFRRLDLQSQQTVLDIQEQIDQAYQTLRGIRNQIHTQQKLVLQERERYRQMESRFDQGQASQLDLSSTDRGVTQAELQLRQLYIRWKQMKLRLSFATGEIGAAAQSPVSDTPQD